MKSTFVLLTLLLSALSALFAHEVDSAVDWPQLSELNEQLGLAELAMLQDRDPAPFLTKSNELMGELVKAAPPKDAKHPLEVRSQLKHLLNKSKRSKSSADLVAYMRPKVWKAMQEAGVALYAEGPHHGWMILLYSPEGTPSAWAEVKLHDDKGDLEVWYTQVEDAKTPYLLDLKTPSALNFSDLNIETGLFVRNMEQNEDEDGEATLVDGKTYYFIFPTRADQDPKPFLGKSFASPATLYVGSSEAPQLQSPSFLLVPHVHSDAGHHH